MGVSSSLAKPIQTPDIRLNEGDNLSRNKIQRIFGSRRICKKVADNGKSLKGGKSTKDQPSDAGPCPAPTTIDEMDIDSPPSTNPFLTEENFEDDLKYRILSSKPDGSSTPPRMLVGNKNIVSPGILGDRHTLRGEKQGHGMVKKHPSPNRQYLENLEVALRRYKKLKMSGADTGALDELTDGFPPRRFLSLRDRNQPTSLKDPPRSLDSVITKIRRSQSPLSPRPGSPVTRPAKATMNQRKGWRIAPRFRPDDAEADEIDELL